MDHLALGSSGRQPISGTTNVGAISDAVDLASVEPGERVALLVGGEGHGLSARWMAAADRRVRIPMRAGVDSLNVAAATAVACYVLGR
nr:TrmH family RNA methyltransferase [Jiangella asiatica]